MLLPVVFGENANLCLLATASQSAEEDRPCQEAIVGMNQFSKIQRFEFTAAIAGDPSERGVEVDEMTQRIAEEHHVIGSVQHFGQSRRQVIGRVLRWRRTDHAPDPAFPGGRQCPQGAAQIAVGTGQSEAADTRLIQGHVQQIAQRQPASRRDQLHAIAVE